MDNNAYLVMVYEHHRGWDIIDAQSTLALGQDAFEHHQDEARKKMGFVGGNGAWSSRGPYAGLGSHFPSRLLKVLSANSVGGLGSNHWSHIALVELIIQGTVLDKIVEATA